MNIRTGIFGLAMSFSAHAQEVPLQLLDNYFDSLEYYDASFGAISIYQGDEQLYSTQFGKALLDPLEFPKNSTRYAMGAASKLLIAATVLKLEEEGSINLLRPLTDFYPVQTWAKNKTVQDLLVHNSGLPSLNELKLPIDWWTQSHNAADYLKIIPLNEVHADNLYHYSSLNYVFLTDILEKLLEMPLQEIVKSVVLKPLKLKKTHIGPNLKLTNRLAEGYIGDSLWVKGQDLIDNTIPGGFGAYSNADDLGKLLSALRKGTFLNEAHTFQFLNTQFYPSQTSLLRDFDLEPLAIDSLDKRTGNATYTVYIAEKDLLFVLISNGIKRPAVKMIKELFDLLDGFTYPVEAGYFLMNDK